MKLWMDSNGQQSYKLFYLGVNKLNWTATDEVTKHLFDRFKGDLWVPKI